MHKDIFLSLKENLIQRSVIKNHYPIKYWKSNKNLFIHLTFWIWLCWVLMALFALYIPVSNQQKLGRGAIIIFESTFQYIVKILGGSSRDSSVADESAANISPSFWNYEAYLFLFFTFTLLLLSAYCFVLVKNFLIELKGIISSSDKKDFFKTIVTFNVLVKYFWIVCFCLTIWTAFSLLYVSKPISDQIRTIVFDISGTSTSGSTTKQYTKTLTKAGLITGFLNLASVLFIVPFYVKYCRELFIGNSFFFKKLRFAEEKDIEILSDPALNNAINASLNVSPHQNFKQPNIPGYIVELENVNKYFKVPGGYFHALKNINLSVKEGDFVVILGYSGSGKTTLLNLLAGIDRPTTGKCVLAGFNTTMMTDIDLNFFRRKKIGYIFQNYALLPNLTAAENIAITQNMDNEGFKTKFKEFISSWIESANWKERISNIFSVLKGVFLSKSSKEELNFLMESLNLWEHRDKFPHQLSGGQQQRVSISRVLIKKPQILLADEPTGAIDHGMTKSILELFYYINEYAKTTIILITHNPLIAKMAKRVLYVSNGQIIKDVVNLNRQHPKNIKGL